MKINQGTKFGTLKKPMFSFFDVIIFLFNGKIEQNILGTTSSEQSENNRLPRIIALFWHEKRNNRLRLLFEEIRYLPMRWEELFDH